MSDRTPSLEEVIQFGVDQVLSNIFTALPGEVQTYDPATQTCAIQPSIKKVYADGKVVNLPQVINVPVVFMRGAKTSITFPLEKGDSVLLVFSQRSLDVWKSKGGVVDPLDLRKFNITDAFAIPGGYPKGKPAQRVSAANLRIEHGTSEIEMQPGAKFKIGKIGGDEFLDLMSQFLQLMIDSKVITAIGPQPFIASTVTSLTQLKAKLDAIKG